MTALNWRAATRPSSPSSCPPGFEVNVQVGRVQIGVEGECVPSHRHRPTSQPATCPRCC